MVDISVPKADFSPLSQLFNSYAGARKFRQQQDTEETRRDALSRLPKNADGTPNFAAAAQTMLQAGDMEGAATLAHLANAQSGRDLQRQQFEQSVTTSTPEYQGRVAAARAKGEAEAAPKTFTVKTPDGEFTAERGPDGQARLISVAGAPATAGNPYATGGPMKEHEAKAALFADRMATAHATITKHEKINSGAGGYWGGVAEKNLPEGLVVASPLTSDERIQVMNGKRSFINALLRRESGAAIQPSEFASYDKEYFPQPGDPQQTIDDKRKHRAEVLTGLAREAGRAYRPKFTVDENGMVAPRAADSETRTADATATPPKLGQVPIPMNAAKALRDKPERRAEFDAKYGAGAAARVLGK